MVKDIRGREIDELVIEIDSTKSSDQKPKFDNDRKFILCKEFFQDGISPAVGMPLHYASKINSAYGGWQSLQWTKEDLDSVRALVPDQQVEYGENEYGVDLYMLSEAGRFDIDTSYTMWVRFLSRERFNMEADMGLRYYQSAGVKRKILETVEFQFCGRRKAEHITREEYGFQTKDTYREIWAHECGMIICFEYDEKCQPYDDIEILVKFPGNITRAPFMEGGSLHFRNGGTICKYFGPPFGKKFSTWDLGNSSMSQWHDGMDGLQEIGIISNNDYHIADPETPHTTEAWEAERNRIGKLLAERAKEYPILKTICFD